MKWFCRGAQLIVAFALSLGSSTFFDPQVVERVAISARPLLYISSSVLIILSLVMFWLIKEELREGAVDV